MTIRLTASALARAEKCPASAILDGFPESGNYAATGTAVDRYVQALKTRGAEAALAEAPVAERPYLATIDASAIPDGCEWQVALAWHPETGEARRLDVAGRAYPDLGDGWIYGTADALGMRDRRVFVADLKWGSYTDGRDPESDLQLGFYLVTAAAWAGVDEGEAAFARAGWDGKIRLHAAVFDEIGLGGMRARIREIAARVRRHADRPVPGVHVGEWCGYCAARRACPAQQAPLALALRADVAAAAAPTLNVEVVREKIAALTAEEKGRLYDRMGLAMVFAEMVRDIVREDARLAPIPHGDGKELREVLWGHVERSPEAQRRIDALVKELRAAGEIVTVKVPQVRSMAAPKRRDM